jgi:hypothetical protein
MREDAIQVMKKRGKSKRHTIHATAVPKSKGRRPNTDNPAYWSGNSAAILQRLSMKMTEKEK